MVGDSLGPVLYGYQSTRKVSLDTIICHAEAVTNTTSKSMVVVDMPYGTYEKGPAHAYKNAKKIISDTGADAVKLEGGKKIEKTIKFLCKKN